LWGIFREGGWDLKISLKRIDPTCLQILSGLDQIKECLSYKSEIWVKGPFKKHKKIITKDFVYGKKEKFVYAGFENRISDYAKRRDIEFEVIGEREILTPVRKPELEGITLRDYQLQAVEEAFRHQQGIIQAGTGTGKSYMAMAICSRLKNPSVLFLVPNLDLATQITNDFKKFGYDVSKLGGGEKEIKHHIVVSTIQTYSRLNLVELSCNYDLVIVDEVHLASAKNATLEKILSTCLAPMRIAFSATVPKENERKLVLEGLFGPIIFDMGIKKGIEMDILATPTLKLLRIPISKSIDEKISQEKTYKAAYKYGIVENDSRNRIIASTAKLLTDEGKICIIYVNEIEHLNRISRELDKLGVIHKKVQGVLEGSDRETIISNFKSRRLKCVVATIWKEGTDIPVLDVVMLAGGGKAERTQLQIFGRGFRKAEGKDGVLIYDCVDCYKYLAVHFAIRINLYLELGWI